MGKLVNMFVIYQFIKTLVTPFNKTEAYKLGIIDAKGNYLKKQKDLETMAEKKASNIFTRLVWNIKKLLAKVPGGGSKLGSFAAALYLIREEAEKVGADGDVIQEAMIQFIEEEYSENVDTQLLREKIGG
jgi:hypothetical protein